jgi:hypothetical protein
VERVEAFDLGNQSSRCPQTLLWPSCGLADAMVGLWLVHSPFGWIEGESVPTLFLKISFARVFCNSVKGFLKRTFCKGISEDFLFYI